VTGLIADPLHQARGSGILAWSNLTEFRALSDSSGGPE